MILDHISDIALSSQFSSSQCIFICFQYFVSSLTILCLVVSAVTFHLEKDLGCWEVFLNFPILPCLPEPHRGLSLNSLAFPIGYCCMNWCQAHGGIRKFFIVLVKPQSQAVPICLYAFKVKVFLMFLFVFLMGPILLFVSLVSGPWVQEDFLPHSRDRGFLLLLLLHKQSFFSWTLRSTGFVVPPLLLHQRKGSIGVSFPGATDVPQKWALLDFVSCPQLSCAYGYLVDAPRTDFEQKTSFVSRPQLTLAF